MRFTIAIDPNLIEEAKQLSGVKTKREAIEIALKELIRRRRLKEAAAHAGKVKMAITLKDLEAQRAER
jgi:Arc/MetJ family transcription regulator